MVVSIYGSPGISLNKNVANAYLTGVVSLPAAQPEAGKLIIAVRKAATTFLSECWHQWCAVFWRP